MLRTAPHRTRHLAPRDKLGRYEVIRQIAIGGMAELYLARTLGLEGFEKLVVLKRILPQYVGHASFIEMFLNEARLAATLHHVNIAQVYDIGLEDGDYFFAMEYVHGEDLDRIAMASEEQGVPLSLDAALTLVAGLCAGLHYAHERTDGEGKPMGIVHRDVSPSNVLVSYDGAVKLVDFGIARAASRPGQTQGGLKGKISYMSPEQCRGKAQLDRRSDLYSVGTILYELTTGRPPFAGETEYQILHQIVNEDVPPPSSIVPSYPPRLERIVLRALARDPAQRYATAVELQTDVEDFAHETRLRISPLVLARLMGTLFPARLEEWDHAKTQGGLFLEQHVVRTLIESGRTPDAADPALAAAGARSQSFGVDDEKTALEQPALAELTDAAVGAEPITTFEQPVLERSEPSTTPVPAAPLVAIPAPPEPAKPMPYPVVTELMSATPGALVTAAGKYGGVPVTAVGRQADPTERVRLPPRRASSPMAFVRARSKTALLALLGLGVAGAGVAAVIALRPADPPHAAPAAAESPRQQMPVVPAEPAVAEPPAPAETTPVAATQPAPPVTARAKPVAKPQANKPPPKKTVAVKPKPKLEPKKPEPKETTWNADSPFMPVRPKK